jgi:hypothetical protein
LLADELFELGDAKLKHAGLIVFLEEGVHAIEDGCLPVVEELGLDVVLAAKFRRNGVAGEELKNDLGFEVSGKRTSGTRHGKTP